MKSSAPVHFSDYVGHRNPPVPEEAHVEVRKLLERFNSPTVMAAFDNVVKQKLFGEIQIINPANFTMAARLEMHSGMCKKLNFVWVYKDGRRVPIDFKNTEWVALFHQSIFNKDVSFARGGEKHALSEE